VTPPATPPDTCLSQVAHLLDLRQSTFALRTHAEATATAHARAMAAVNARLHEVVQAQQRARLAADRGYDAHVANADHMASAREGLLVRKRDLVDRLSVLDGSRCVFVCLCECVSV
jgi:hypothetical protein